MVKGTGQPSGEEAKAAVNLRHIYIALLKDLQILKQLKELGEDDQSIVFEAVRLIKRFLDVNPQVRDAALTRPFGLLLASINDLRAGSPAALFRVQSTGGAPRVKSRTVALQATAAACFTLLRDAKVDVDESAQLIVLKLSLLGYRRSGRGEISAKTIIGWRDEMGGNITGAGLKIYEGIIKEVKLGLGKRFLFHDVRKEVCRILAALVDEGIPSN